MKFNDLSDWHKSLFNLMLNAVFIGKDEIKTQIYEGDYEIVDVNSSLSIYSENSPPAKVISATPVEVEALDADGMRIHGLLLVTKGFIYHFQLYREDGTKIRKFPAISEFEVMTY